MVAPVQIHISETESLPLLEWCEQQAERFTKEYSHVPLFFTDRCILHFISACTGDAELRSGLTDDEEKVAASICKLLARSREIEEYAVAMTAEATVEREEMARAPVEIVAIPESEGQQEAPVAQETRITVLPVKEIGAEDRAIVDAAISSRLDNSFTRLNKVFRFDPDMASASPLDGITPTAEDYGRLMGLGNDLGKRSLWLLGEATRGLIRAGKEDAVHQISDAFGFSYSHVSNWSRVVEHVSPEDRVGLLPSVAAEICCYVYDEDPVKNQAVIDSAIKQVKEDKMNCLQARSLSRMLRGKDDPIDDGTKETAKQKIAKLEVENHKMKTVITRWLYDDVEGDEPDWDALFSESIGVFDEAIGASLDQPEPVAK